MQPEQSSAYFRVPPWWLLFVAYVALLFLRMPERFIWPQLVVEDWQEFVLSAERFGFASLWKEYGGFYTLSARVGALFAVQFDKESVAWVATYYSLFLELIILAYLFSKRSYFALPVFAGFAIVLAPSDGILHLSLTLSIWMMGLLLLVVFISKPPLTFLGKLTDSLVVLFASLSGPFCVIFFPILACYSYLRKERHVFLLLGICLFGCFVQGLLLGENYQDRTAGELNIFDSGWPNIIASVFGSFLYYVTPRTPDKAVCIALSFFVYAVLFYHAWKLRKYEILTLLLAGLFVGAAAVISHRFDPSSITRPLRYSFLPCITVIWALLEMLPERSRYTFFSILVLIAVFISSRVTFFFPKIVPWG